MSARPPPLAKLPQESEEETSECWSVDDIHTVPTFDGLTPDAHSGVGIAMNGPASALLVSSPPRISQARGEAAN
jgi:hypothetical protein